MADYNLGTARAKIIAEYDGKGTAQAKKDFADLGKSAEGSGTSLAAVGAKAGVAGLAISAGFGLAAKTAIDFEKQISAIGAVSGASGDQLEALTAKALELGTKTSFSASEAALAMEELAKAGLPIPDILNGAADAAVALAAAGGVSLAEAAELAADAMNSFNLEASDLGTVADFIAGAANASSISVGDFGQSLKQVGAVANLAGVSFEDTATAIALMGKMGIKGSDAGTSLKTMLQNLQPTTAKQIELFRELGLVTEDGSNKFFDQNGQLKSLSDVSGILKGSLEGMTDQQKLLALETIFGTDAIRAAAVLAGEGSEGFDKMAESMSKVSAEQVAAQRLDNTAGTLERLKGSVETAAISIGTLLLPAIEKIANALAGLANWFNGLSDGTKNAIVNIGLMVTGLLLGAGSINKVASAFKSVASAVSTLKTVATSIRSAVTAMRLARVATVAWTAVQWLLNAALTANPIGLVVIAVAALVAAIILLWKKSETFRNIVTAVWNAVKAAAQAVADWFMTTLVPFFQAAWEKIKGFFSAAWGVISGILNFFIAGFQFFWGIISGILGVIGPVFKAAFDLVVAVIQTAWAIISAIFAVMWAVFSTVWSAVLNAFKAVFSAVFNAIAAVVSTVWNGIKAVSEKVWNALSGFLSGIWNGIKAVASTVWNAIKAVVEKVWNAIKPFVEKAVNTVKTVVTNAWNAVKNTTSTVWNAIKSAVDTVWNAVKSIVQKAVDKVVSIIDGIKKMVDKVRGFFNDLKNAATGGTDSLISFVKGIPGKILGAIGNLGKLLYSKGKELIQGLIDGISNMIGSLKSKVSDVVGVVGRFLPGSPAKEGPLSGQGYILKRGRRMMDDFATGIVSASSLAKRAMEESMAEITSGAFDSSVTVNAAQTSLLTAATTTGGRAGRADRSVSIENVNISGANWDLDDPEVPRKFVARLHEELDRYEREHR